MGDNYNDDGSGTANNFSEHRSNEYTYSSYPTYDQGKDIEVDRAELELIATVLERDLEALRPHLDKITEVGGSIQAQHLGGSQTAADLVTVTNNAHRGLSEFYEELKSSYTGVIQKLRLSAQGYGDVEQQNLTNADRAGQSADNVGTPATSTGNSTTANTPEWHP